jgi:hypothetical protein
VIPIGGGITEFTLELFFSPSNITLVGRSFGGPITANWFRDDVLLNSTADPSYAITLELEPLLNYPITSPFKSVLVARGYKPGEYTYSVWNRVNPRNKTIIIEGISTKYLALRFYFMGLLRGGLVFMECKLTALSINGSLISSYYMMGAKQIIL